MKQGAYIAMAGLDPVAWVQEPDAVLSLYTTAVAEHIHETRADQQKKIEDEAK